MTKIFTSAPTIDDIHGFNTSLVVNTERLKNRQNPFESIWSKGTVEVDEILEATDSFIAKHKGHMRPNAVGNAAYDSKEYHVARVAWLVKNPLAAHIDEPMTCFVSVITFQHGTMEAPKTEKNFEMFIGSHSLAAAFVRGDEKVQLEVHFNDPDDDKFHTYLKSILGVKIDPEKIYRRK